MAMLRVTFLFIIGLDQPLTLVNDATHQLERWSINQSLITVALDSRLERDLIRALFLINLLHFCIKEEVTIFDRLIEESLLL